MGLTDISNNSVNLKSKPPKKKIISYDAIISHFFQEQKTICGKPIYFKLYEKLFSFKFCHLHVSNEIRCKVSKNNLVQTQFCIFLTLKRALIFLGHLLNFLNNFFSEKRTPLLWRAMHLDGIGKVGRDRKSHKSHTLHNAILYTGTMSWISQWFQTYLLVSFFSHSYGSLGMFRLI